MANVATTLEAFGLKRVEKLRKEVQKKDRVKKRQE